MLELIKEELANVWKWIRQHWKGVIAVILATLALSLVLAFPIASITLIGTTVPFNAYLDMEIILFFLQEIPVVLMFASTVTALFTFIGVLGAASLFNFANRLYATVDENVFRPLLKNQTIVAVLVVVSIASMALVAAFSGGLWFIPVAIAAVPVINKVTEILDRKINPRCDFITLPADLDTSKAISEQIVNKMKLGRYSYFIGHGHSYFRQGDAFFQATWDRNKVAYFFEPVSLVDTDDMDKLRAEQFRANFPLPNKKQPNEAVYKAVSLLNIDSKVIAKKAPAGSVVVIDPVVDRAQITTIPAQTLAPSVAAVVSQVQPAQVQSQVSVPTSTVVDVTATLTAVSTTTTTVVPISPLQTPAVVEPKLIQGSTSASNLKVFPNRSTVFQHHDPENNDVQPSVVIQPESGITPLGNGGMSLP